MKVLLLSIFENFGVEGLWELLGWNIFQLFGRECGSSMLWMVISLLLREILILFGIEAGIPYGIIFAFPFVMRVIIFIIQNIQQ
jgi:hypothetical protein